MVSAIQYLNSGMSSEPHGNTIDKELGKSAFMELLVAQMSYQDPLEPMENTEFVSQLAQFSSLEQQQNIAAGIELLALTQTAATNSQMVNLIGKRVLVPGDQVSLDGENPADIKFRLDGEVAPSELVLINPQGETVRTIQLDNLTTGTNKVTFDGKDESGNALAPGNYQYLIRKTNDENPMGITTYSSFLVDSVSFEGSSIILKSDDVSIKLEDISEVNNP